MKVAACVTDILFLYSVFSLSLVSWFNLSCYFQVAWYRLFARSASGNNVKVRLNDYQLPGTGEEVFVHDIFNGTSTLTKKKLTLNCCGNSV